MMESSAQSLQRLVASTADLLRNAPHPDQQALDVLAAALPEGARNALPPPCREPFCGGFNWNWEPPPPPRPLLKQPLPDLGLPRLRQVLDNMELNSRGSYSNGSARLTHALKHLLPRRGVLPIVGNQERLDFLEADFFPPLRQPVARQVELQLGGLDGYPEMLVTDKTIVVPRNPAEGKKVWDSLNEFLRVSHNLQLSKSQPLRTGQRLLAVRAHPRTMGTPSPTFIAPFFGKGQLQSIPADEYPLRLIFGGRATLDAGTTPPVPVVLGVKRSNPVVPVKRLDIVLRHPDPEPAIQVETKPRLSSRKRRAESWLSMLFGASQDKLEPEAAFDDGRPRGLKHLELDELQQSEAR